MICIPIQFSAVITSRRLHTRAARVHSDSVGLGSMLGLRGHSVTEFSITH
jgi:hypothetical protein